MYVKTDNLFLLLGITFYVGVLVEKKVSVLGTFFFFKERWFVVQLAAEQNEGKFTKEKIQ